MKWCPDGCGHYIRAEDDRCADCRRRRAWGTILTALASMDSLAQDVGATVHLDESLAAVALLMQDRQALVHQHRRDMTDEQKAANRAARETYDQGHDDGRRESRGDW